MSNHQYEPDYDRVGNDDTEPACKHCNGRRRSPQHRLANALEAVEYELRKAGLLPDKEVHDD